MHCSCRLSQNLPELPLSAHLLAPIQRICRYPLHLSELVKHTAGATAAVTTPRTDDKESLEMALAAMKRVTEMVNEGECRSQPEPIQETQFRSEWNNDTESVSTS